MSENTGGLFEEVKGSNDSAEASTEKSTTSFEDSVLASLDMSSGQDKAEPTTVSETDTAKVEPVAFTAINTDTTAKDATPANLETASALPKISIDTSAVTTSRTIPLASLPKVEVSKGPVEDRGFLTGLKETSFNMVTGMTSLVTNENKTREERILNPDQKLTGKATETMGQLAGVAGNVLGDGFHSVTGLGEDSKTASAIGQQLSDHWTKMKSGNMESWGNTTAFVGSIALPGAMATKGGTGLLDDGLRASKTIQTATKAEDVLSMANRIKVTRNPAAGLVDNVAGLADETTNLATKLTPEATTAIPRVPISQTLKTGFQTKVVQPLKDGATRITRALDEQLSPPLQLEGAGGITMPRSVLTSGDEVLGGTARTTVGRQGSGLGVTIGRGNPIKPVKPVEVVRRTTTLGDEAANAGTKLDDLVRTTPPARNTTPLVSAGDKGKTLVDEAGTGADDLKTVINETGAGKPVTVKPADAKPLLDDAGTGADDLKTVINETGAGKPATVKPADAKPLLDDAGTGADDLKTVIDETGAGKPATVKPADAKTVTSGADDAKAVTAAGDDAKAVTAAGDDTKAVTAAADDTKSVTAGVDDTKTVVDEAGAGRPVIDKVDEVKVRTNTEVNSNLALATDEASNSARQLTTSSDEFTRVLDDVTTGASSPAQRAQLKDIRTLTEQVKAGTAEATAINRLNTSVRDLAKTMGADDAQRLVDKVDELTVTAQRSNASGELVRQTAQTADNFSTLSTSLDAISANVANKTQIDDVRTLAAEVAKGSTDANTIVRLNNAVKALKGSLDPSDFNTITNQTNNLTRTARQAATTKDVVRTISNASDNVVASTKQLGAVGDDFTQVVDDFSAKVGGPASSPVRQELDNITQLTKAIKEGATDATTINRLNTAVRELGESLAPAQADDFAKLVKGADELTISAQRSRVTTQLANQTAKVGESFTSTTRVLDDISGKVAPSATSANRNLEVIRNLTEKVANGTASKTATTRLNKAVAELGEALGPKFSDDLSNLTTKIDELTQGANRSNLIKEVSTRVTNASDEFIASTGRLQTTAQTFNQTIDDVVARVKPPAGSTPQSVSQNVRNVKELSTRIATGTADDATIAQFNASVRELGRALGPDDLNRLVTATDDLTVAARHTQVSREVTRQVSQSAETAIQATRAVTTSFDEVSNTLKSLTREVTEGTTGQNAARLQKDIKSLETASRKVANGTADAKTINGIESTLTRLNRNGASHPQLSTHLDDLNNQVVRLTRSHGEAALARQVSSNVMKSGDDLISSTKLVTSNAQKVEQTVASMRNSVTGLTDDAARELDNIAVASRQIVQGSTNPRTIGMLETSVNRLAQTSGTRFGDDLTRLVDDSRELIKSTRNLNTVRDTFASTTRTVGRVPVIADDLVMQSNKLANTISNVSRRATAARSPQIADDLNVLEDVTRQIGSRTETAASIRQAEAALNRLARTSNRQLGDDVVQLVDETRQFVRNARQNGPANIVKSSTDELVNAGDDLALKVQRARQQSAQTLPQTVSRELDEITNAAKNIGRNGADDTFELNRIQTSLRNLEATGAQGRRIAETIRDSVSRVQNSTVQSRRAVSLNTSTTNAVNASRQITTSARTLSSNGTLSNTARRQLDEIAETADNIVTSSNPSVGIKSIQRNMDELAKMDVPLPSSLRTAVGTLDDSVASMNAIRHMDRSRNFVSGARNLIARTADDGTHVTVGTKNTVVNSLDDISRDMGRLSTAKTGAERSRILSSIDESLDRLRTSNNSKLANEIDEAVRVRNLEQVANQNAVIRSQLESTIGSMKPGTGSGALSRADETVTITKLETIAKEIASGNTNPNLITALERNLANLSKSNQDILRPIVDDLDKGMKLQTTAANELAGSSASVIADDLARISQSSSIGRQLDGLANVRQRLDLIRHVHGADTPILEQMRSGLIALEDGLISVSRPRLLGQAARWTGQRLGLGSTYSPYSVDGLSSTSSKVRALTEKSAVPGGLVGKARIILNENPALVASAAMNSGLLVGSYFVAEHMLRGHLTEINRLAAQLRDESQSNEVQERKAAAEREQRQSTDNAEATRLKVNTEPASTRQESTRQNEVVMEFSPALGQIVRKADIRSTNEETEKFRDFLGISGGSEYELRQAMHDYRDSGKTRRWQALASLPSLPVELAQSFFTVTKPIRFKDIEGEQPKVSYEKPAQVRFNLMTVRKIISQRDPKYLADSANKKGPLYAGATAGAGLAQNLQATASNFYSDSLLQSNIENAESKLDNLASVSGGTNSAPTSFTTYSSPSGLQFAKNNDPNSKDDEDDNATSYTEALSEANDAIV